MTPHSIHYDSTRLIRIRIIRSDSADACTRVGTSARTWAARSWAMCYQCYDESKISPTTRLALSEFQASCYSHHQSQSALGETNWLLGASGCNLTLNPYLVIQMVHHHEHPLAGAMELRPDHWSVTPEVPPRDPKELHANTDQHS